ncbi:MAG: endonuclease/exonuclease/phosphatase family protein [Bacteroidetes bacterium]|nr:endonuclease/exonuclease/phosphatase family protein [Bacteroidota bacterium]
MALKNSIFLRGIFTIGCLYSACYLLACATPFISPVHGYFFSFASLFFPFILLGMIGWVLLSFLFYRRWFLLFLFCLAAGYQNISAIFGFHPTQHYSQKKMAGNIRILSWNVNSFLTGSNKTNAKVLEMMSLIKSSDADILCFQDYSVNKNETVNTSPEFISQSTQLKHVFFSKTGENYGVIIFSRWPFVQQCNVPYSNIDSPENLAYVDIQTPYKVLRVYNTHLSSMNMHVPINNMPNSVPIKSIYYDKAILLQKSKLSRLAYFDKLHTKQGFLIKKSLDSTALPFVFTADLNAVPSSHVYHTISEGLSDAFLLKGFGFGRTYDSLSPTLRIDVLLTNQLVKVKQFKVARVHLSDHFPIISDIQINP